ncbi:MAG: hypothetical protein PVG93_00730 [Phycisphaerales bacterium]
MRKALKTSTRDRKCAFPGCTNVLSIYNHEDYCHIHRDQMSEKKKRQAPYRHVT